MSDTAGNTPHDPIADMLERARDTIAGEVRRWCDSGKSFADLAIVLRAHGERGRCDAQDRDELADRLGSTSDPYLRTCGDVVRDRTAEGTPCVIHAEHDGDVTIVAVRIRVAEPSRSRNVVN